MQASLRRSRRQRDGTDPRNTWCLHRQRGRPDPRVHVSDEHTHRRSSPAAVPPPAWMLGPPQAHALAGLEPLRPARGGTHARAQVGSRDEQRRRHLLQVGVDTAGLPPVRLLLRVRAPRLLVTPLHGTVLAGVHARGLARRRPQVEHKLQALPVSVRFPSPCGTCGSEAGHAAAGGTASRGWSGKRVTGFSMSACAANTTQRASRAGGTASSPTHTVTARFGTASPPSVTVSAGRGVTTTGTHRSAPRTQPRAGARHRDARTHRTWRGRVGARACRTGCTRPDTRGRAGETPRTAGAAGSRSAARRLLMS